MSMTHFIVAVAVKQEDDRRPGLVRVQPITQDDVAHDGYCAVVNADAARLWRLPARMKKHGQDDGIIQQRSAQFRHDR